MKNILTNLNKLFTDVLRNSRHKLYQRFDMRYDKIWVKEKEAIDAKYER